MRTLKSLFVIIFLCSTYSFVMAQGGLTRPKAIPSPGGPPSPVDSGPSTTATPSPAPGGRKAPTITNRNSSAPETITQGGSGGEDDDIIRVETNLVAFPVTVLDREGRFIPGLTLKDFQIFEDGAPQSIKHFESVETPFTVVLMLDVSPSTRFRMDEIQAAAVKFVDQLRPEDRVMVVSFDEELHLLTNPTNDRRVLYNAIRQTRFGNGTALYDAVDEVITTHLRQIEGRKAVVLFTDGVDTGSGRASFDSSIVNSEETEALFYTIRYDTSSDMNGGAATPNPTVANVAKVLGILLGGNLPTPMPPARTGSTPDEYQTGRRYLEKLSESSGGRSFEAGSDIYLAFTGIAEELRRQYTVGYYPETTGNPGDRKQIRVRVMQPNLVVRARTSYVIGRRTGNGN